MTAKHVAIIGAGPAGLGVAAALVARGVAYTLLERGDAPVAGLRAVDPAMRLFSPARLSKLHGMQLASATRYATFAELVAALERYREQHAIAVTTNADVTAIDRVDDGFVVRCHGRAFAATHVVSATGIVARPRLPDELDVAATRMRWIHSLDVRREHVANARRLLVVGAGASAADVLANWREVRRADDRAWIAVRSELRAMPSRLLGIDSHYWVWPFEFLPGRPFGPRLSAKDAMFGTTIVKAIRAGEIAQVKIARYHPDAVELVDGSMLAPDLVVFATGFHHATPHLAGLVDYDPAGWPIARRCESRRTPNVFVVGTRFARSLASSFLRGIARDATYVARAIASR